MTPDVPDVIHDTQPVTREKLAALTVHLATVPQVDLPVRHFFANGLYGRELYIPAGVCAVGRHHKHEQITIVMGDCTLVTPGEAPRRIVGYEVTSTPAGVERAVYAHADTFITTFHPNPDNLRDPDELVAVLTDPPFGLLESQKHEALEAKP